MVGSSSVFYNLPIYLRKQLELEDYCLTCRFSNKGLIVGRGLIMDEYSEFCICSSMNIQMTLNFKAGKIS